MKRKIINPEEVGEKIIVIGSPGARKSNFARNLMKNLNNGL